MFAPKIAGQPVYVVQSRSVSTNKLYAWNPKASLNPIDLGFGSAAEDASLGREGLNGNPLLPTVHALGTDPNGVRNGFIQKGFPLGGSEDDRLADGLVLDSQHLAGGSIATSRDAKTGADQRPAAVFNPDRARSGVM